MTQIMINCDGGARGNPGPAAYGCVIQFKNQKSSFDSTQDALSEVERANLKNFEISDYLGSTTNNQAEYKAVIAALSWMKEKVKNFDSITMNLDSQLVVEQLNGNYKLKNEGLKPLYWQVRDLVLELEGKVSFCYIPRTQNKLADRLVNKVLDGQEKKRI